MNLIKVLTYVLVFVLGAGCYYMYIRLKISKANADAKTIVEEANTKADNLIKEATLDAKTKAYEYKLEAEKEAKKKIAATNRAMTSHSGCPGSKIMQIRRTETSEPVKATSTADSRSKLQNWPVQIKLAPVNAPYFNGSKLLIAADCTAYAYAAFHQDFIRNKVTLIGCPKLDQVDYSEKLTAIIQNNNIQSVTIVRMEVPCCGGLEIAAKKALQASGKFIPWQVVTISIDVKIME